MDEILIRNNKKIAIMHNFCVIFSIFVGGNPILWV